MKKGLVVILVLLFVLGSVAAWLLLGSATTFSEDKKYLYVRDGQPAREQVMEQLNRQNIIRYPSLFESLAGRADVWKRLKPGRFEIRKGENLVSIVRKLRNNQQSPVRLVINKLRTREDFARLVARQFEMDSAQIARFVNNNDSLARWQVDTASFFTLLIPDTYELYWTTSLPRILNRLEQEKQKFWNRERSNRLARSGLTELQLYTIASIVEEETNKHDEKGKIASVYINRLHKGMPLGADPTIKYALRDFAIRRILHGHLNVASPYNTYRNKGLPPGPICTPSKRTLDEVLKAPSTNYLYFVARSDFSGYHDFSETYEQHQRLAQQYHQALDAYLKKQQNSQP